MNGGRVVHTRAALVGPALLGRTVMVLAAPTCVLIGVLSDVVQHPTAHRTVLYIGGDVVDVRDDTTVTTDTLGALGGAA